jgi:hypothetical protein
VDLDALLVHSGALEMDLDVQVFLEYLDVWLVKHDELQEMSADAKPVMHFATLEKTKFHGLWQVVPPRSLARYGYVAGTAVE